MKNELFTKLCPECGDKLFAESNEEGGYIHGAWLTHAGYPEHRLQLNISSKEAFAASMRAGEQELMRLVHGS